MPRGPLDNYRSLPAGDVAPTPTRAIDAAKTTNENRRHWAESDGHLHPVSQFTPTIRKTIRERARYEVQNNSYAAGLIRTLVGDTVGTGPRLQMLTDDGKLNEGVEDLWRMWCASTNMALNFRVLAGVKYVAGECFAVFRDSKKLERMGQPVTLNLRLIDPARVADPFAENRTSGDDGIDVDDEGEVVTYRILQSHPGDFRSSFKSDADTIKAENVLHWYQPEWPEQMRGHSPLSPALDLFGQLRRFTKATLTSAEVAAMLSGVITSDLPVDGETAVTESQYFDTIEMVRGMLLTLPSGTNVSQFRPEQPTTNYQMFVNAKLRECGRCLNVPFGKMAGDHSNYNYSSGRMDDAPYWHDRDIERQELEAKVFDPTFYTFARFAAFTLPALAKFEGKPWELKHAWHYDAKPSSDPVKDATGDESNLTNASDTLSAIAARDGTTARALLMQRRRDADLFAEFDLPLPPWFTGVKPLPAPQQGNEPAPITREEMVHA